MERTLDFTYDEIVIGADLSALFYSYTKNVPLIFKRRLKPNEYGINKDYENNLKLWNHYLYMISMAGLCPLGTMVQTIRIEDDNTLKVTTNSNFLVNIRFNKLIISDDYGIEGLPSPYTKTSRDNCVIDYMGIFEYIPITGIRETDVRVPKIINHKKEYLYNASHHRHLIVTSIMSDEELKQIDFSEGYMRLRMKHWFDEPERVRLKHIKREHFSLGKNLYNLPDNIKVLTEDIKVLKQAISKIENKFIDLVEKEYERKSRKIKSWNGELPTQEIS